MKKLFAAAVSVAALYSASAFAADMPMKAPVYRAAAPGYNWTGWYAGVNVGVGVAEMHGQTFDALSLPTDKGFGRVDASFSVGAQVGYNWQVASQWVFGFEGDVGYLRNDRSTQQYTDNTIVGVKADGYGTLRGRLGYTNGPSLFYATGGAAFVNVRNNFDKFTPPVTLVSKSEIATGWTAGAGIETMLGGHWSAKTEYLYIDAGHQDVINRNQTIPFDNSFHVYRYGLNYKFDGPAVTTALPVHNWTGFYTGLNAGAGVSQSALNTPGVPSTVGSTADIVQLGFSGGVQAGYNWQFAPQWVLGLEGDIGYLGIKHIVDIGDTLFSAKTDWYGTVRGRLGYSTGSALLYATGGAAFVKVRNSFDGSVGPFASASKIASGWTVGSGIEAALAQNWTAKTEYLYIDAGKQDVFNGGLDPSLTHFNNRFHVFRAGLNYHFNAAQMAPVAARY